MTKVKLCGLRTMDDIGYANEARPDMAGMILAPGFGRTVPLKLAEDMARSLSDGIELVGVFVDQPLEEVKEIADRLDLDLIQLHGSENDAYVRRLKELSGRRIIKSFGTSADDLDRIGSSSADLVLIDPGRGSGKTFDLSVLDGVAFKYILAGGLTPDNVGEAIRRVRPHAVDTSSGTETDGRKDRVKMMRFVQAVRTADEERGGMA